MDLRSVHFLSFPTPKESLIDADIEAAVAKMQTVIELGRVIRDRNTMPIKYPLKQVIVVMETDEALKDVQVSRAEFYFGGLLTQVVGGRCRWMYS